MRAYHRDLIRAARDLGARRVRLASGGRHKRLVGEIDGQDFALVVAGSPSDVRAIHNSTAELRRCVRKRRNAT